MHNVGYEAIDQEESAILEMQSANNKSNASSSSDSKRQISCCKATLLVLSVLALLLAAYATNNVAYSALFGAPDDSLFDFIVVGGGPSGSVLTRQLVESGAKVLLLEAGVATQHDLGGKDYFGGPVTRFDIPFLWTAIPQVIFYPCSAYIPTYQLTLQVPFPTSLPTFQ
jgi:hypothetical protein